MPLEHLCPKCGGEYVVFIGADGKRFTVCSNVNCNNNYDNQSREVLGKNRRHFKLTKEDYVEIHEESDDYTVGFLARKWGVSRKQIRRILDTNLSDYAERIYGEPHVS